MLKPKLGLILLALLTSTLVHGQTKKVLFIGNSYTYFNDLPQLTADVAASVGDNLTFDSHTPGGTRFLDHAASAGAMTKIFAQDWDHVVLQAQSQEPSWPISQVQAEVFPYAELLCDTIRANDPCTRPIFFMTWGRENGDAFNCPNWPPVCTYEGMDSLLYERYRTMGDDNEALVSPVGAVWRYLRQNHPTLGLYTQDGSHPSALGSYAAACTFYSIIFQKDPTLIQYDFTLNPPDAQAIRTAAKLVAFDSLSKWNIGAFDPQADFFSIDTGLSGTVGFNNSSTYADSVHWDFGDGNTSSDWNPTHVYTASGTYNITLIAFQCGLSDTIYGNVTIVISGVNELIQDQLEFYPNPTTDQLNWRNTSSKSISTFRLFGPSGRLVRQFEPTQRALSLSGLAKGVYLLETGFEDGARSVQRIVLE